MADERIIATATIQAAGAAEATMEVVQVGNREELEGHPLSAPAKPQ